MCIIECYTYGDFKNCKGNFTKESFRFMGNACDASVDFESVF